MNSKLELLILRLKITKYVLLVKVNTKEKIKIKCKHNKLAHCTVSLLILISVAYGRFMQLGAMATC